MTPEQQEPCRKQPDKIEGKVVPLERSTRLEDKRFWTQCALSTATLILTPFFSAMVVWFQLSNEHSFVSQQTIEAKRQTLMGEKIRLAGEASKSCEEMLGIRHKIQHDHFFSEFWAARAEMEIKRGDKEAGAKFNDMSNQSSNLENEDELRLATANSQFRSVLLISNYYFDSTLQIAIQKFISIEYPTTPIDMNPDWSTEDIVARDESRKKAENEYADQANAVVGTMAAEVAGDLKSKSQ